jgi:hypothetical protein
MRRICSVGFYELSSMADFNVDGPDNTNMNIEPPRALSPPPAESFDNSSPKHSEIASEVLSQGNDDVRSK